MASVLAEGRLSTSKLCSPCQLILSRAWDARILVPPGHALWETPIDTSVKFPWHTTLAEVHESAASGCHLCVVIVRYAVRLNTINEQAPLALHIKHEYGFVRNEFAMLATMGDQTGLQLCFRGARDQVWDGIGARLAYGYYDDSREVPAGLLKMLRDWISGCKESHRDCNKPFHEAYPGRLIEIRPGDGTMPKLCLVNASSKHRGQYITLSHCWGPNPDLDRFPRTRIENLDVYFDDIPFNALTPTFQDAITVTQGLGLRYLWIDSLCIVQNDTNDWERESVKMADIYANSLVTIAGTGSGSSADGLFLIRDELEMTPVIWPTPESRKYLAFHPFLLRDYMDYESNMQALYSRAWCMQELTLSRRVMHFLPGQVILDCSTSTTYEFVKYPADVGGSACLLQQFSKADLLAVNDKKQALPETATFINADEQARSVPHLGNSMYLVKDKDPLTVCFGHPRPSGKLLRQLRQVFTGTQRRAPVGSLRSRTQKSIHDEWAALVENYTQKDITYPSDRLPAIWSFATRMHEITKDEYLCGIWRSDIPRGLVFMIYDHASRREPPETAPLSPSWSWASREGRIRYYGDGRLYKTKAQDPLCQPVLLSFTSEALSMGRSTRAALRLRCIVATVIGISDPESDKGLLRYGYLEMSMDNLKLVRDMAGKEMLVVHMLDFCALLLVSSEEVEGEYRRAGLGYVRHQGKKGFREVRGEYLELGWEEREIVIV